MAYIHLYMQDETSVPANFIRSQYENLFERGFVECNIRKSHLNELEYGYLPSSFILTNRKGRGLKLKWPILVIILQLLTCVSTLKL